MLAKTGIRRLILQNSRLSGNDRNPIIQGRLKSDPAILALTTTEDIEHTVRLGWQEQFRQLTGGLDTAELPGPGIGLMVTTGVTVPGDNDYIVLDFRG